MKKYIIYKYDYSDSEWYDLINVQERLPEFEDLFDEEGEISEDYAQLFTEGATYVLLHENVRITDEETLQTFLLEDAQTTNSIDEDIKDKLRGASAFQLSGDNGGFGFILDIWYSLQAMLCGDEPIKSYQFWFDDYLED